MTQSPPEYGEELNSEIAESLRRLSSQKLNKETIDRYKDVYKPPINCKTLGVPRVNKEIWPLLPQKARQGDYSHQQIQQLTSMAAVALSRIAETVYTAGKKIPNEYSRDLLKMSMEASSILGSMNFELNQKRKNEIKPSLNKEFAGICSNQVPVTEWLFGDNITDQLKASKSTASVFKTNLVKQYNQGQRFTPYNYKSQPHIPAATKHLNWKRSSFQSRGGPSLRRPRNQPYIRRSYSHPVPQ